MRALALLPLLFALAACGRADDGGIEVAVIGEPAELFATGNRLAPPGALVRAATAQGLVRLDEAGQLVPGIAERWIVTEDAMSYIFRIREMDLPGGKRLDARGVQHALSRAIAGLEGTTLGLDLAQVRDVRAMTGRVIEIRLIGPMPDFLQLLAQPELGIAIAGTSTGPMTLTRAGSSEAMLTAMTPEARGLPAQPDWAEEVRTIRLAAGDAAAVTRAFSDGRFALVLGGTLATLPLVDVGPLSRGTVRVDSALGLFGLEVRHARGFLAEPANREALAMALDRAALIQPFNLAGWTATTRIVPPGLPDDPGMAGERWEGMDIEARRAVAAARVARWRAANGGSTPVLSAALPAGPGADTLFAGLAAQYREIGLVLARAETGERADLVLRDRVARYAGTRWFLNQFNCGVSAAICSPDVDFLVALAVGARDPAAQASYLADAENALTAYNAFIPIGAPIRWSLVRSGVAGFAENAWAIHPLFPLSRAPI
jgi:oligopeptide transport system substrate-binding protein